MEESKLSLLVAEIGFQCYLSDKQLALVRQVLQEDFGQPVSHHVTARDICDYVGMERRYNRSVIEKILDLHSYNDPGT